MGVAGCVTQAAAAARMDRLTALFFEDPVKDGIQLVPEEEEDLCQTASPAQQSIPEEQGALFALGEVS